MLPSVAVPGAPLAYFPPASDRPIEVAIPLPELIQMGLRPHPYRGAGPHCQLVPLPSVDAVPIEIVAETF